MSRAMQAGAVALAAVMFVLAMPDRALAHETRDVAGGRFQVVVGFMVEPAFEGQKNGVELRVRTTGTPASPVTGVERTLQVELTHVASNRSTTLPLRAVFNTRDTTRRTWCRRNPGSTGCASSGRSKGRR